MELVEKKGSDDRRGAFVLNQVLRRADGGSGGRVGVAPLVVALDELRLNAANAAVGVDLRKGELGAEGETREVAGRLNQSDDDRIVANRPGRVGVKRVHQRVAPGDHEHAESRRKRGDNAHFWGCFEVHRNPFQRRCMDSTAFTKPNNEMGCQFVDFIFKALFVQLSQLCA